jgi:hypothetical protein
MVTDVDQLINIASGLAQFRSSIDRGTTNVWVLGHIVGVSMGRIVD